MKITTIIPMYNSKDTIKNAIESVINQTYKDPIEIIVVNDGSSDGCEKIVEEMILNNQTNRIIKLINKKNGGVSSARNRGIKEASGEWIALLDSDDIWLAEKLQKQVSEIKKNANIKFIGTNRNDEIYPFFNKNKNYLYTINAKEMLLKWWPSTPTVMFDKNVFFEVGGYDEKLKGAEDGDFWLRCTQKYDIYVLNEFLVNTGHGKKSFGESGLSANMPKMYEGEILALKGAKKRKQINLFEYLGFYLWLTLKYYRRILIVKSSK
jgi:glycosyltransferase involved in cell wall biosynthesis